jgi:fructose-bisphosphate aldolase class 1
MIPSQGDGDLTSGGVRIFGSATELYNVAKAMVAKGKGILAIDESFPSIKKRFDSIGIESTAENRPTYREILITTPGGANHISGMILFDETIHQSTAKGETFFAASERQGSDLEFDLKAQFKDHWVILARHSQALTV